MPLAGVRVVAADEFWADRPQVKWPPTVLRQTDANGREVYWGLAAAQDLTNALGKVLGRAVPLYRESEAPADEGPVVYLGPVRTAAAAGLDAKDMMSGEWRIKCDGKRAFILARTGMGVAYGVTDFLDKFAGYRFLTMDGDDPFTVTPAASVPECDFTAKHCFYERHFSVFDRHLPDTNARWTNRYMRRLGLYISPEAEGHVKPSMCFKGLVHTYTDILPPEKYFASHPEYFTMDAKGNRVNGPRTMLCLSNPEVRRLVTDKFLEAIAKDRDENPNDPPIIYDFTQTDGIYYICKCPECRKIAAKYGGDANMDFGMVSEGDAGLQLDFVNEMARKIGAKYPDVRIRTFAYVNTSKLPKGIVPEPNVMPWFCDWYMKSDHQLPLAHPFNTWCREQLEKWKAVSPAMEIYDYMLYDNKYPEVSVDAIAADMRDFKKLGIARFYILSPHRAQCFWQLNTYVYSKFFRDPDTDLEKAIDEYCAVYGAGAAKMREAIDFLRKIIAENPPKSPDLWHKRTLPWRTMENMERLREIVREAMSAETRMKPLARMALVLESVDRELARFYKLASGRAALRKEVMAEWKACAKMVYDGELFAGRDRAGIRKLSEDDLSYMDFKLKHVPDELKGVQESEIIAVDVRSSPFIGFANKKVQDPESECDTVVRIFPADPAHPLDWAVIRDPEFRQRDTFNVKPTIQNGYRWYRLGVSRIGRAGDCALESGLQFALGDFYVECDGMAEDPNWYEFWLSVKYNGDPFSKNEKEGLFVDRLLLRHFKKP